jgi:hypothetical protein
LKNCVGFTGWTDKEKFSNFLAAADICVQLRSQSRGETSGAVLDCMKFGKATIINAHGSLMEISDSAVLKIQDNFTEEELVDALIKMIDNPLQRHELGARALNEIESCHSPEYAASLYSDVIEKINKNTRSDKQKRKPRLYIDISALIDGRLNAIHEKSAKNELLTWLKRTKISHRVEPIYGNKIKGYRRAQEYTFELMNIPLKGVDTPVEVLDGDILVSIKNKYIDHQERK